MEWPLLIAAGAGAGVLADRIATIECRTGRPGRPLRIALVAAATAVLFVVFGRTIGIAPPLPAYLWFGTVTVTLALVDLCERRIPNRILLPGTAVAAVLLAAGAVVGSGPVLRPFAAGATYFAVLYATGTLSRGGIGAGDVKLSFLLGMFTGYISWEALVVGVVAAFVIGGVAAIIALAAHRRRTDAIAFGPYLILGAYTGIVGGGAIAGWYLGGWA
jgi:leader peptidase (prepilin peptidase)/N-methyltransferase